jgi:sugar phosphate isomerase/epimerase
MISCFHSVGLPDRSATEVITMAAEAGYAAIEFNAETLPWAPPHVTPATPREDRLALVETAKSRGIEIIGVGAHIFMLSGDKAHREAAITFVNGCTDLAVDLGTSIVHILSGPQSADGSSTENWRWFADAVARTTDYARRKGVALGIEAIAGHLFHEADDYGRLIRDLPGVDFKVNFDPSHLIVQGENPMRVIDAYADRINHMHMKDGSGRFPDFAFPPLGRGDIDFQGLVSALRRSGYTGAYSVEYEAQVFGFQADEATILASGLEFLKSLDELR